jgi:hypothetical protein
VREQHTAAEIRAEVKRLFNPHGALKNRVPQPYFVDQPPSDGPNWGMPLLKTRDRGIQTVFVMAVQEVRSRWDLKE